jgi:hypothetical protein
MHQQDCPALVVERQSALEDDALNVRDFSVSPIDDDDIWGGAKNARRLDGDLRSSVNVHIQLSYF